MARVTVAVNVRDMTRGDLARLRRSLNGMTESVNRFTSRNTQGNLEAMRRQFAGINGTLEQMRGRIPTDEFNRMERSVTRVRNALDTTIGPVTADRLGVIRQGLRELNDEMSRSRAGGGGGTVTRRVRVQVDNDTDGGLRLATRSIARWASGPLRGLTGLISGTLRDGIGQGLVGAFRSPTFGAVLVAAIVAALSVVGAALAGILVLAIGGAFAGLGGYIAAQSKTVTDAFSKELEKLKPLFRDAAEPMIPVLVRASRIMGEIGREFAPHLKEALEKAAPHIDSFISRTKEGLRRMGENGWDSLQQAFRIFLDAFGPHWEEFLAEFGSSLGALARTVSEHSEEMAMALRGVLGVINLLIDTINFFANAWVLAVAVAQHSFLGLMVITQFVAEQILAFFATLLEGAEKAFSWVPGLGGKLAQARAEFGTFQDTVNEKLASITDAARVWGAEMDLANKKRKLEVDIDSWMNQINTAKEEMESVPPERKAELRAKIDDLTSKVNAAKSQLNSIQPNYYVRIHAYKTGDWALGLGGPQARGGVTGNWGRAATGGARSNMTLVGEQGPELVDLAPGSHVRSNADTRRMLAQTGGQQGATTLILKSDGSRMSDVLLELLRDAIHDAGGDPVKVLGG